MAGYKLKTKSSAKKRYRVNGSGRIKLARKGKRHIFTNKSRKRKRQLRGMVLIDPVDEPKARRLVPYA